MIRYNWTSGWDKQSNRQNKDKWIKPNYPARYDRNVYILHPRVSFLFDPLITSQTSPCCFSSPHKVGWSYCAVKFNIMIVFLPPLQLPPASHSNVKRRLIERFKKSLFHYGSDPYNLKVELSKVCTNEFILYIYRRENVILHWGGLKCVDITCVHALNP